MFCKLELFSSLLIAPSLSMLWFESPRGKQSQRNQRSNQRECLGNTYELPVLMFILLTLLSLWGLPRSQVGDAQGMVMRRCHDFCLSLSSQAIRVTLDLSTVLSFLPLRAQMVWNYQILVSAFIYFFWAMFKTTNPDFGPQNAMYQSTEYRDSTTKPN